MNPLSYEVELYGLAIFLYLYDSSVLLYGNEAILTVRDSGGWTPSWGWSGFLLAGRTLCMLNPFTPHHAPFRLGWKFREDDRGSTDARWAETAPMLKGLMMPAVVAGVALFAVLPLGLFSALGSYAIGAAVMLLYGSTLLGLYRLRRQPLLMTRAGKTYWGFAFECLACPPFAVNMVRRLSMAVAVTEPLPVAAARLLTAESWENVRADCLARVDLAIERAGDGSEESLALAAHKEWLRGYRKGA